MIKIDKKLICLLNLLFIPIAYFLGKFMFYNNFSNLSEESTDITVWVFLAFTYIMPIIIYIMYLFMTVKKIYAHIIAFLNTIIINYISLWHFWPVYNNTELNSPYNPTVQDELIDICVIFSYLPILLCQIIFAIVYLVIGHLQKKKKSNLKEEITNAE